jgi:CheY-like chemotaxis protein
MSAACEESLHPILIVDDDESTRECLKLLLETHGYSVMTAGDGYEALGMLHEGPTPALILLDLMMPGMDGYQFRQQQMAEPLLAEIPVVLYTCCQHGPAVEPIEAAAVLQKPLDIDILLDVVATHCRRVAA